MPSQGSVITRVFTSDAYLPLEGVPVLYTSKTIDSTNSILGIRFTDNSGLTSPLYVATPDAVQSQSPDLATRPYSSVDITVAYPGYRSVKAEGVQIFPDVQTIQQIQLLPISQQNSSAIIYFEPPQAL